MGTPLLALIGHMQELRRSLRCLCFDVKMLAIRCFEFAECDCAVVSGHAPAAAMLKGDLTPLNTGIAGLFLSVVLAQEKEPRQEIKLVQERSQS
jgi:hypothetical protein